MQAKWLVSVIVGLQEFEILATAVATHLAGEFSRILQWATAYLIDTGGAHHAHHRMCDALSSLLISTPRAEIKGKGAPQMIKVGPLTDI